MSRPTAISPEEQEQIARRIGVLLLQAVPEQWQQVTVEYRATGEYHDLLGEVILEDGSATPWEPPEELQGIFQHLREGMYRPDVGTWLSALYVVERPSSYRIDINFDAQPQWRRPLPRAAYVDELRRYPRTDENIPDWMREKLRDSAASRPGDAEVTSPPAPAPPVVSDTAQSEQPVAPARQETPQAPGSPGPEAFSAAADAAAALEDTPASTAAPAEFRIAKVFDEADEQGRPLVATRLPVSTDEAASLRQYLDSAPIIVSARENVADALDSEGSLTVPATWHTDGIWVWQGAVGYYLAQYGVPPERELIEHIRSHRFTLGEVDERTREAAAQYVRDNTQHEPDTSSAPQHTSAPQAEPSTNGLAAIPTSATESTVDTGAGSFAPAAEDFTTDQPPRAAQREPEASEPEIAVPATNEAGSQHSLADEDSLLDEHSAVDEPDNGPDTDVVLARLHEKLSAHGVNNDLYRIGEHDASAWSMINDGADWIVAPATEDQAGGEVRFGHPEQAAAFLLGSLLMNRQERQPEREDSVRQESVRQESGHQESGAIAALSRTPAAVEPEPEAATQQPQPSHEEAESPRGGHFLFSANQTPADDQSNAPVRQDSPAERQHQAESPETPQASERPQRQSEPRQQPEHASQAAGPGDEATRIHPAPRPAQPAPPAPQQPGQGQADQRPGPGRGPQGQPPLPQRPARPDHVPGPGPADLNQRPPAAGHGERRPTPQGPGMAGPPRQGPVPPGGDPRTGGPGRPPQGEPPRPPQGQPQPPGGAPAGSPEQQIQPLRGEPPLTLYRDRRPMVLQPGTDVDRFGDANGNVTYALRTPYSQRSLPPQWSSRPYGAYRVQRPLQVLRGTAVPWFEQPGGGTAYVLPAAISDLVADGTLHELKGPEAPPQPSMD